MATDLRSCLSFSEVKQSLLVTTLWYSTYIYFPFLLKISMHWRMEFIHPMFQQNSNRNASIAWDLWWQTDLKFANIWVLKCQAQFKSFHTYAFTPHNGTLCYCCPHVMPQETRAISANPDRWAQSLQPKPLRHWFCRSSSSLSHPGPDEAATLTCCVMKVCWESLQNSSGGLPDVIIPVLRS